MVNSKNEVIKMFLIKKLCLEIEGVSVEIPEEIGAVFNSDWTDENSIVFNHSGGGYTFAYEISYNNSTDTRTSLVESIKEISEVSFSVEPFGLNGLEGHHSTYAGGSEQYYEARFLAAQTESGSTELTFVLWTKNNDIEEIKASPEFKKLLHGIRKKDIIE